MPGRGDSIKDTKEWDHGTPGMVRMRVCVLGWVELADGWKRREVYKAILYN